MKVAFLLLPKSAVAVLLLIALSPLGPVAADPSFPPEQQNRQNPGSLRVVELFTSQGCSACPAADRVLDELAGRPGILALSWPVDYWDYMGWKDTLARPSNAKRQLAYVRMLGTRYRYTPQAVINGAAQTAGFKRQAIEAALEAAVSPVTINLERRGAAILAHIGAGAPDDGIADGGATIWLLRFAPHETVAVRGGENRGRTLSYRNVVREEQTLGVWSGEATDIWICSPPRGNDQRAGFALVIQHNDTGPVLGAALLD
jgi:hypothetical protein